MATSPEEAIAKMIASLEQKTGKSIDRWVALAGKSGQQKHGEIVGWLKSEHGVTHGYANLIAHGALKSDSVAVAAGGTDLIAEQDSGAKAPLRPIYDALIEAIERFGSDVEISLKKAYVSVRRSKQFAIVQPSTATRIDVGLNLKGTPAKGRLEASGSFNAMVSHRVRIEKAGDVDKELIGWLKAAYDAS